MNIYTYDFVTNMGEALSLEPLHIEELSDQNLDNYFKNHATTISQKGCLNSFYGYKHTEESKKKISEKSKKRKGWKHSEETKRKIRIGNVGKQHTEESKKKMSVSSKGERNGMYGKHQTEEAKEKVRQAKLGKKRSAKDRAAMSAGAKNRVKRRCQHCDKYVDASNFGRWHGDKCGAFLQR